VFAAPFASLRTLLIHPAPAAVVVPSRAEPFGRIPLEAFVAGAAPVVATTAGGLAELVTDQTGYSARPADAASLADALDPDQHQVPERLQPGQQRRVSGSGGGELSRSQHPACRVDRGGGVGVLWVSTPPVTST
jgi:hypothetical protein